jgi:hypothetical protein
MYREACAAVRKRSPVFEEFTAAYDAKLIQKWSSMKKNWTIKDGKYWSPYEAHIKNGTGFIVMAMHSLTRGAGPPMHRSAYEKLITLELTKSIARGTPCAGVTEFISKGLHIEKEQ